MTVWRICIASWMWEATNTVSKFLTLIAFPLQQWLHRRASVLLYMYTDCLDKIYKCTRERNTSSSVFLIGSIRPSIILSISEANEDNAEV